eukprot:scaffold1129_cov210-Alexandrium_tamarense.AAC.8
MDGLIPGRERRELRCRISVVVKELPPDSSTIIVNVRENASSSLAQTITKSLIVRTLDEGTDVSLS